MDEFLVKKEFDKWYAEHIDEIMSGKYDELEAFWFCFKSAVELTNKKPNEESTMANHFF